ncbi:hypothetical protein C0416_02130 [bacterium]|nr:hypothetical protein [bacterium]
MHNYQRPFQTEKKTWKVYVLFAAIGITLGAGFIGYPKLMAYLERMAIEEENQNVMAQIIEGGILDQTIENFQKLPEEIKEINEAFETPVTILENAYLEVPFVCQAPFQTEANWVYHEESCEEAALLQVRYYLEGVKDPKPEDSNATILDMIEWQKKNFGEHKDVYANDMKSLINGYYDYPLENIEIIYDATITDIKKAVSMGYPIIVPIMGDILKNPYYPYPGYHMLTIIGYTPDKIITNDVGTRRGKDFSYSYDIFMKALEAAGGDVVIIKQLPLKEDGEA